LSFADLYQQKINVLFFSRNELKNDFLINFAAVLKKDKTFNDFVAQLVEQQTLNLWVVGSTPTGVTLKNQTITAIKALSERGCFFYLCNYRNIFVYLQRNVLQLFYSFTKPIKKSDNMATFTGVIFPHHQKQNGSIAAKIRATHNRQTKYIPTNIVFFADQYTKAFKMKNCTPKFQLDDLVRNYTEKLAKIRNIESKSVEEIIDYVTRENPTGRVDFLAFYESEISEIKNAGTAGVYKTSLNHLRTYTGGVLFAEDIDYEFVKKYAAYIEKTTQGRAVSLYLANLRHILNQAKNVFNKEEIGEIRIPLNPFNKFKIPKQQITKKRTLTVSQIRQIRELPDKGIRWDLARDCFMLSFYLMGMNSADMYHCSKCAGRIEYERRKTKDRRSDNAFISIKIQSEAIPLLKKYTGKDLLFCFSKMYGNTRDFNKAINLGLKQIGEQLKIEDLEFYAARHSFASIGQNVCGIDKYTIHECLNHTDPEMKVTDMYIRKDWSRLDTANRIILNRLKWRVRKVKRFSKKLK